MNTLLISSQSWLQHLALLTCKGAVLALALGLVLLLLRRHVSPAWRHGLWLFVLLRFALPDIGTSSLSLQPVAELPAIQLGFEPLLVEEQSMPPFELDEPRIPATLFMSPPVDSPMVDEKKPAQLVQPVEAETPSPAWTQAQWLFGIWLSGVLAVLVVMLSLHLRLLARLRQDASPASVAVMDILKEACELAGISRRPRVIVTDAVRSPALFGVLNPAILLPRELAQQDDAATLKLVFLHELAHLHRQDLWAQIATSIIIALHWFNPVVWWAARRMRAEAEMAADARALAYTHADEAHRFGTVLLSFASRATAGWMLWLAAATVLGISENKHDLRRRIEALKDIARGRRTRWIVGMAAFLLLALAGLTKAPAQAQATPASTPATSSTATSTPLMISGIVVDEAGKPISGAKCALSIQQNYEFTGMNGVSGADGRFTFGPVPLASSLSLSASHRDYAISGHTQFNSYSEPGEHRIVLPSFTWVTGRVTDKRTGKPIANARVFYGREQSPALGTYKWSLPSVRVTEKGEYRLPIKTPDTKGLIIRAWAQNMASRSVLMDLNKKETTYDVALEPAESIPGKVVNAEGQPVKDAFVWVIEDRFVLNERDVPLTAEFLKSKDMRQNLAEGRMFVSLGYSGDGGAFKLHAVDPLLKDRQWVAAIHPEEGIAFLPAKDMTSGMLMKLHRWASFSGVVKQADGSPFGGRHAHLMAGQNSATPSVGLPPSLHHYVPFSTGPDGSYQVERLLPNSWLVGVGASDDFHGVEAFRIGEGSVTARNILLRPSIRDREPATIGGRMVRGRLLLPAGRAYTSDEYIISPSLRPDVGRFLAGSIIKPDAEGRFLVDSVPPGTHTFSVMVMPRKRGLLMNTKGQIHLRFKLEPGADAKPYDLPDIVLDERDFVFESIGAIWYEVAAEGGFQAGDTGRVEVLAADREHKPVAHARIKVVDFADQARQPLKLREIAGRVPEVMTDAQGKAVLTFPRGPAQGIRAAGLMVEATGLDGVVSRESSVMDGTRTRVTLRQSIPLEVTVTPKIESWTTSSWMELAQDIPAIGGTRLSGALQMARGSGFIIRGRQADGSVLFSTVYKTPEAAGQTFQASVSLAPAVTLEGQISPVSQGQKLDGWVALSVTVQGEGELGVVSRGFAPLAIWHAWAPVRADGRFVIKDIPRGRVSIYGMGQGWQCAEYNPDTIQAGATRLTLALNAKADLEQPVKILLPDGTPVKDATLTKSSVGGYSITSTTGLTGVEHVVAPEDAAAYASFKKAPVPGLRLKTNAQGEVTLTHHIPGRAGFEVYWLDDKTGQPRRSRLEFTPTVDTTPQNVTLMDVRP